MSRVIIVSNRVSVPGSKNRAGGLEVVLRDVIARHECAWFGWSGEVRRNGPLKTTVTKTGGQEYIVTDLSKADYDEYYNGFANRVLWPILHYRIDLAEYSLRDLGGYIRVNEHFADELHKHIAPDDVIWVHDYHLIPLAKELRKRGHKNRIGFFLHIPLPPPELLVALPQHEKLFPSLCHYDLVGFQTETDCDNFARYLVHECKLPSRDLRSFLFGNRSLHLGVFPVSVNSEEVAEWAARAAAGKFVQRVAESLDGRALMIGVDRLDYSKGILSRIQAVGRLLELDANWRGRFTFLQIAPPTRNEIQNYADIEESVSTAIGRINSHQGEADWTPIRYLNKSYSRDVLAGLYRKARVGLVTPLRDGMNLVALEFVCAQDETDPGVLVLSRFAGAAAQCKGALLVNPYDTQSMAEAMACALSMPREERIKRHRASLAEIRKHDARLWGDRFIGQLEAGDNELSALGSLGEGIELPVMELDTDDAACIGAA